MLLNDFRPSKKAKIGKINKFLSENFGISMRDDASDSLQQYKDSLSESLESMKRDSYNMKSEQYAKTYLSMELVTTIMESGERPHTGYRMLLGNLYNTAVNLINIGDDIDEAVGSVMREYRSSQYRFPDDEVEHDLRSRLFNYISSMEDEVNECSITEDETGPDMQELWFCDDCTLGTVNGDYTAIDDEDRYQEVLNCVQNNTSNVSYDGDSDEFSRKPCDCCHTDLAGRRTRFFKLYV